jgi:hypothetical protein
LAHTTPTASPVPFFTPSLPCVPTVSLSPSLFRVSDPTNNNNNNNYNHSIISELGSFGNDTSLSPSFTRRDYSYVNNNNNNNNNNFDFSVAPPVDNTKFMFASADLGRPKLFFFFIFNF